MTRSSTPPRRERTRVVRHETRLAPPSEAVQAPSDAAAELDDPVAAAAAESLAPVAPGPAVVTVGAVAGHAADDQPRLGWMPFLALVSASGLVMLALAYSLASRSSPLADPLYWSSFLVIAGPILLRLASVRASRAERLALVIWLGLALFLVHVLRSPNAFTGYDELLHYRSLNDVLSTGRLFSTNPLLAVSPLFPGLEILTSSVVQLTGADPFIAGNVVLACTRVLFAVALYLLFREAGSSDRIAGLGTGIYMLNPNYTFFDSQFAYESLALPFVPVLLLITARRARTTQRNPLSGTATVVGATLIISHHVTTIAMAAMLAGWLVIHLITRRRDIYRGAPIGFAAALVILGATIWFISVGSILASYLGAPLAAAIKEIIRLITTGEGRAPFQAGTGVVAPIGERAIGLITAGLLTLSIPIGLVYVTRRLRHSSLALLLGLLALAYPASLLGRLTPTGSEAAGRTQAFIALGLSFVAAVAVVWLSELASHTGELHIGRLRRALRALAGGWRRVVWRAAFAAAVVVIISGGVILGSAPATRFPGPYVVGADRRSITAEGVDAALWTVDTLGPDRRIAADRINRLLVGSYGRAHVVFHGSDGIETWQLFTSSSVGPNEITRLHNASLEFLMIDRRLSTALPLVKFYWEEGEIYEAPHTVPVSAQVLGKWDQAPDVDRVYDSGNIQIYDVRDLSGTP